ncbi:hypothetical protein COU60_04530 [Candidatus Pacearchaeota archaeon CG10_big_fil_rev_8_21_14_0_10_34_76]|nr:MAG: hypothetical protein COU60_04530 [Candidatus Pacearchaeota archaeon CG10_big_fil_rev_8_21_14_0_10_34_76]
MSKTECPKCGKSKQPWFDLCFSCNEKEKQKPTCEVCGVEVQEGWNLCTIHYNEKQEQKKKLKQIDYVKDKKQEEFKEKFEGKYYYNSQKVKSKSELLICYFLSANQVQFAYEPLMNIDGELRPDFVIEDSRGHFIILEHFGLEDKGYLERCNKKIEKYKKFCQENTAFSFVSTKEEDIYDLKDKLGKKLNETPLKRAMWR